LIVYNKLHLRKKVAHTDGEKNQSKKRAIMNRQNKLHGFLAGSIMFILLLSIAISGI